MYCKKCGTKQQDGHTFCPKCGTPFGEIIQTKKEVVYDVSEEKVEKVLLDEKTSVNPGEVLPGSEGVETKHVHENVEASLPKQNGVRQDNNDTKYDFNPEDVKYVGRMLVVGLGIAIIALPFLMHGFSFGWFWYLTIVAVGYLLYKIFEKGVKKLSISEIKKGIVAFFFIGFVMFMWGPLSSSYVRSGSSSFGDIDEEVKIESNNEQDEKIIEEMERIHYFIKCELSRVESLYEAHQQHMAKGYPAISSPAWGKWQNSNQKINKWWDEYIRLARDLSGDNEKIIEEARESKRTMDESFLDMFSQRY